MCKLDIATAVEAMEHLQDLLQEKMRTYEERVAAASLSKEDMDEGMFLREAVSTWGGSRVRPSHHPLNITRTVPPNQKMLRSILCENDLGVGVVLGLPEKQLQILNEFDIEITSLQSLVDST